MLLPEAFGQVFGFWLKDRARGEYVFARAGPEAGVGAGGPRLPAGDAEEGGHREEDQPAQTAPYLRHQPAQRRGRSGGHQGPAGARHDQHTIHLRRWICRSSSCRSRSSRFLHRRQSCRSFPRPDQDLRICSSRNPSRSRNQRLLHHCRSRAISLWPDLYCGRVRSPATARATASSVANTRTPPRWRSRTSRRSPRRLA